MTLARKLYEASCEQMPVRQLPPWERLHADAHAHWEALASVATSALTGSDAAVSAAVAEERLDAIERLVATRKGIEYGSTEEQRAWRVAKAILVEAGRSVK